MKFAHGFLVHCFAVVIRWTLFPVPSTIWSHHLRCLSYSIVHNDRYERVPGWAHARTSDVYEAMLILLPCLVLQTSCQIRTYCRWAIWQCEPLGPWYDNHTRWGDAYLAITLHVLGIYVHNSLGPQGDIRNSFAWNPMITCRKDQLNVLGSIIGI